MARKPNRRTVLNRQALNEFAGAVADGLGILGAEVVRRTHPPDAAPFGEGLVTEGDWGVWAGTRKVGGGATRPRSVRLPKTGLTLLVGFGFPARFQELGTINQPSRPFFTPPMADTLPAAGEFIKPVIDERIGSRP